MEAIKIENYNFSYNISKKNILKDINLSIEYGEFVLICGESGCGKTTLLRNIKKTIAPFGKSTGKIIYNNCDDIDIGYVFQNPDNQIVSEKVYSELAFGLENLGYESSEIKIKIAEISNYFGIQNWFQEETKNLSGGQKQILNLASVMVMDPKILILDEPTAQLDPIARMEFLDTIKRLNEDFSITIIICEHNLEEVFKMADSVIIMKEGKVVSKNIPNEIYKHIEDTNIYESMPSTVKLYCKSKESSNIPLTIKESRKWLKNKQIDIKLRENEEKNKEEILKLKNIGFSYKKKEKSIIEDLSLNINRGEVFTIVGGNGSGKSTVLALIANVLKPTKGKLVFKGKKKNVVLLPQDVESLFVKDTVIDDLKEIFIYSDYNKVQIEKRVKNIVELMGIEGLLNNHPYDLSGGEKQKVGLAKIVLLDADIVLLDEPTKGLDSYYKKELVQKILKLKDLGKTIIIVTHDIEFAAMVSNRVGLLFDKKIINSLKCRDFFKKNSFYTTEINKITKGILDEEIIMCEEVIAICGKEK